LDPLKLERNPEIKLGLFRLLKKAVLNEGDSTEMGFGNELKMKRKEWIVRNRTDSGGGVQKRGPGYKYFGKCYLKSGLERQWELIPLLNVCPTSGRARSGNYKTKGGRRKGKAGT